MYHGTLELGRVGHDYWADCKRPERRLSWYAIVGSGGLGSCTQSGVEKAGIGHQLDYLCILDSCRWLAPQGLIHPMVDLAQVTTFVIGPYDTDTRRARLVGSRSIRSYRWTPNWVTSRYWAKVLFLDLQLTRDQYTSIVGMTNLEYAMLDLSYLVSLVIMSDLSSFLCLIPVYSCLVNFTSFYADSHQGLPVFLTDPFSFASLSFIPPPGSQGGNSSSQLGLCLLSDSSCTVWS